MSKFHEHYIMRPAEPEPSAPRRSETCAVAALLLGACRLAQCRVTSSVQCWIPVNRRGLKTQTQTALFLSRHRRPLAITTVMNDMGELVTWVCLSALS